MLGLVSATELIAVFVALEIMSVALYALAGMRRDREESQEAALKYFVTGAFSSGFFLYGVALLYGASGSTLLDQIGPAVATLAPGQERLVLLGSASCSWASASRSPSCPSTCGRPTSTRARPPPSPRSWPRE